MAVPTWKTQAVFSGDAALRAMQAANVEQRMSGEAMTAGFEDIAQVPEDVVMREAKTALMDFDNDADRAIWLDKNPSSYLDPDKINTFRKELLTEDKTRRVQGERNLLIDTSTRIAALPDHEKRMAMNEFSGLMATRGIKDTDNIMEFHIDNLLRNTDIELSDETLIGAGVILGEERSYTPDVHKRVMKSMKDTIRQNNIGASETAVTEMATSALNRTKHGAMFERAGKVSKALSTVDREAEIHATTITEMIGTGNQAGLEKSLNDASAWMRKHPSISKEQTEFIQAPMLQALDGVQIDAYEEWLKLGVVDKQTGQRYAPKATLSNQKEFRRILSAKYKERFKFLDQSIFDKKIDELVAKAPGGLAADFQTGQHLAGLKTESARQYGERALEFQGKLTNDLFSIRDKGIVPHIRDKLAAQFEKWTLGDDEEFTAEDRGKLTNQASKVIKKIYGLFKDPKTHKTTLTMPQKQTLDIAIQRFLVGTAGIDPETGSWLPWDEKDMVLTTIDRYGDMSGVSENMLMEELMTYLPDMRDRNAGARVRGAVTFDTVLGERLKKWNANPKNTPPDIDPKYDKDGNILTDFFEYALGNWFTIQRKK